MKGERGKRKGKERKGKEKRGREKGKRKGEEKRESLLFGKLDRDFF